MAAKTFALAHLKSFSFCSFFSSLRLLPRVFPTPRLHKSFSSCLSSLCFDHHRAHSDHLLYTSYIPRTFSARCYHKLLPPPLHKKGAKRIAEAFYTLCLSHSATIKLVYYAGGYISDIASISHRRRSVYFLSSLLVPPTPASPFDSSPQLVIDQPCSAASCISATQLQPSTFFHLFRAPTPPRSPSSVFSCSPYLSRTPP